MIGVLTVRLHLPACASLKEKRGRIKPLLARLRRKFNVAAAEMDLQDQWQEAVLGCAMIGNDSAYLQASLQAVQKWISGNWPDGMIVDDDIELI